MSSGQGKMGKELVALKAKVDDLEARSCSNNLRIVGIAESTAIDNMEGYVERLEVQLLGRDTFSSLFYVAGTKGMISTVEQHPPEHVEHLPV
ncbi:hypothetical protein NDU88_000442 [Pleurodeles waltl]|uniref:Uncharacterized protein n=1 Tax=Pleurodeles waltl TaxID=8319 RepID=A0AAV7NBW8_PLEWA|nr:hypothetical protein NDU88_000442 [Pleurodeles waltl]